MNEIVVDANVFAHAENPHNEYFNSALALVTGIIDSGCVIALDDTGKSAPSTDCSNLYREYTECLAPGGLSLEVIRILLDGRVLFYRRPKRDIWEKCVKLSPKNNNDAIVLGIGCCASRKEIVSNDYADFSAAVRKAVLKELGVRLSDSDEFYL